MTKQEQQCQCCAVDDGKRCTNKAIADKPVEYIGNEAEMDEYYAHTAHANFVDGGQDWPTTVSVYLCPTHNPERIVCFECHRDMTDDEIGDEFPCERFCLQCSGLVKCKDCGTEIFGADGKVCEKCADQSNDRCTECGAEMLEGVCPDCGFHSNAPEYKNK